jgi:hypothetical protein
VEDDAIAHATGHIALHGHLWQPGQRPWTLVCHRNPF